MNLRGPGSHEPLKAQCAICGSECREGERASISLQGSDDSVQGFFVHWQCLRSVIHPSVPLLDVDECE